MGLIRLRIPQQERISDATLERAYVAGLDSVPTESCKSWESDGLLRLERSVNESGCLHIPWDVEGHGEMQISTASLMERERPYHLQVELARGTLNRLRSKADVWRMAGLELTDELQSQIHKAVAVFTRAATSQHDVQAAAAAAEEAIALSLDAMVLLGQTYAGQVLRGRHEETSPLKTLLAGNLGTEPMSSNAEPMFGAAFNAAVAPFSWKMIQPSADQWQWTPSDKQMQLCHRYGLKILGGPLVHLDEDALPVWVLDHAERFEILARLVQQFVTATVNRYRGQVQLWHCAAGINLRGYLPLSTEQRLRLAVLAVEVTQRIDPRTPVIVSCDQPWGEYMATDNDALPPMHIAETLARAGLGIAGIGLEINFGYWPGGTLPRDILAISEGIDYWGLLGLPLILLLNIPGDDGEDPNARSDAGRALPFGNGGKPTPQNQKALIEQLGPLLLAKQSVQAMVWNQVFDAVPHRYPHAGVFNTDGMPKPALSSLINLRRDHLE
jgi:hypothetical protein